MEGAFRPTSALLKLVRDNDDEGEVGETSGASLPG